MAAKKPADLSSSSLPSKARRLCHQTRPGGSQRRPKPPLSFPQRQVRRKTSRLIQISAAVSGNVRQTPTSSLTLCCVRLWTPGKKSADYGRKEESQKARKQEN
jgi:hypothetical protein